jgi:hypothetical protein
MALRRCDPLNKVDAEDGAGLRHYLLRLAFARTESETAACGLAVRSGHSPESDPLRSMPDGRAWADSVAGDKQLAQIAKCGLFVVCGPLQGLFGESISREKCI